MTAIRGIPGRIVSVDGERLAARRWGDLGMVSGEQLSRVELDGQTVDIAPGSWMCSSCAAAAG